ncbi:calcium-independent phospholipase A2 [Paragonimus westermani]|uniref:phospholipase A2 n=1 Tax=Paragonimus westermani TaxID=34504 RepID=A0A5J4NT55_9TREM|nr:calcium-independent phospholipase A2 [Paragonimus westermani]
MDYLGKYVSNVVKTAWSSISPNKIIAYTERQYDSEYKECDVLYSYEPLFYFLKVANHFEMTYIPRLSGKQGGEDEPYAFRFGADLLDPNRLLSSLFRFQGDEDTGIAAFTRLFEVLHPLHMARSSLNLPCDRVCIERITTLCREQCGWSAAHIAAALPWPEVFYSSALASQLNQYDQFSGMTPLRIAIVANDMKLVDFLLSLPAIKLSGVDNDGNTVLHLAAKQHSSLMITSLLAHIDQQVDVNAVNGAGNTALHIACQDPSLDCVEQLLNAGADPLVGVGELPLQLAVVADSVECVELIYRRCPQSLNCPQMNNSAYPLHLAHSTKMFRRLCELGANLDVQDATGLSVLHMKVRDNDLDAALYLLAHGADPNLGDSDGSSPLHCAITSHASIHIIRALLIFEADPSAVNNHGKSPRHLLCTDSVDYVHSEEKDLALYTLHAVGARRCPPSLSDCTIGCVHPTIAADKQLVIFDGTAPEVTHNLNDDAANLFHELFSFANQQQQEQQQRDLGQPGQLSTSYGFQRRNTRWAMSCRYDVKSTRTPSTLLNLRNLSPVPSFTTNSNPTKRDTSPSLRPLSAVSGRPSSSQQLSRTPDIELSAEGFPPLVIHSDPEEKFTSLPEIRSVTRQRLSCSKETRSHTAKLRFISRGCTCDASFLKHLVKYDLSLSEAHSPLSTSTNSIPSVDTPSVKPSFHASTSSLNTDHSDLEDFLGSSDQELGGGTASKGFDKFCPHQLQNSTDMDLSLTDQAARRRKAKPCWSCGPHGYRVLSMDGGGVRGLILVQTLRALERITGKRVTELFDWIIGTSTGGILSLMLVRGKCLHCCRNMLFAFKENVFCGRRPYPADGLEKVIRRELGEQTKMTDLKRIRVAVTTVLSDRCPPVFHMFRNYTSPRLRLHELLLNGEHQACSNHPKSKSRLPQSVRRHSTNSSADQRNSRFKKTSSLTSSSSVFNFLMTASGFRPGGDSTHPIPPVENENDHKFKPLTPDSEQFFALSVPPGDNCFLKPRQPVNIDAFSVNKPRQISRLAVVASTLSSLELTICKSSIVIHFSSSLDKYRCRRFSFKVSVDAEAESGGQGGMGITLSSRAEQCLLDWIPLAWLAARATGAAPTYFRPCGRFLDGGLISNNPTLDLLTELQEMNMAQRLQNKRVTPLSVVVSLGTGRMPVEPIETVDVFRPQSLMETFRSAMGFSSLGRIVVEVATMSEAAEEHWNDMGIYDFGYN